MTTDFGLDIRCINDADELLSEVSGVDLVVQDAIHRITCDSVIGPGGDGWGKDIRREVGKPVSEVAKMGPVYSDVLLRDERIDQVTVNLTAIKHGDGTADIIVSVDGQSALGPFKFIRLVSDLTSNYTEGQS